MNRSTFLKRLGACALLPLLPAWTPGERKSPLEGYPVLFGDGEHDDTHALQALFNGESVWSVREGRLIGPYVRQHAKGIS